MLMAQEHFQLKGEKAQSTYQFHMVNSHLQEVCKITERRPDKDSHFISQS
jgi:hypothetical protein